MKNYYLEATPKTPKLNFDPETGKFEVSGRSIPENSIEFYRPLMNWLDEFTEAPTTTINFDVKLEYFNTSSSKCLVEIFRKLEKIQQLGNRVEVNWYYEEEDEDMQESGEDFKEIMKLSINIVRLEEE